MLTIREAIDRMMPAFGRREPERVALADALSRIAASELCALEPSPAFDHSAMDGYAVRAADVAGATEASETALPVHGESRAGGPTPPPLPPGRAMRIFTGAPIPDGADAVVIQEDTDLGTETVRIRAAARASENVRRRGEDLSPGARMIAAGDVVGPGEIGLLASQGISHLDVVRRPVVAIVSTGDELRGVDEPNRPGSVVDSNRYALAAAVALYGGIARPLAVARDDLGEITARLQEALGADLVLTTGGVSVGAHDLVRTALERAGVACDFWKVRIKPGKPLTFGTRGDVPVVGLPGNPVSALVTFEVFVRPGLRRMLGDPTPFPGKLRVALAAPHRHGTGRTELARARLERAADGTLVAHLHARQGSGSLPSVAHADALVILPEDRATFDAGETLDALPLGPARGEAEPAF